MTASGGSPRPASGHILVIDPAVHTPELAAFNRLATRSPLPLTYHQPALHGMGSLAREPMGQARGIIIFGSASSVNDRLPWQVDLEAWLKPHLERAVPTFGICYGHQMLAYMFGGSVDYLFPDRFKLVGYRDVSLGASRCWSARRGPLLISHNECVNAVPFCMKVCAHSQPDDAPPIIEALEHESLPIWSLQSHPEAITAFASEDVLPAEQVRACVDFGHQLVDEFFTHVATAPAPQA